LSDTDDDDIDRYKPEHEVAVSAQVEVALGVRTSGRIRSELERYVLLPKVLPITVRRVLKQYGDRAQNSFRTELQQLLDKDVFAPVGASKLMHEQLVRCTPEVCCCINCGVGDMQYKVMRYGDDLLGTCGDSFSMDRVISALKAKYLYVQEENTGVKHWYLGMSEDMSAIGMCCITAPMFISEVLTDVVLGSAVTPTSGILFMIDESSPLLEEACRKRYHGKVVQGYSLGEIEVDHTPTLKTLADMLMRGVLSRVM
jgi:hypothetical protein